MPSFAELKALHARDWGHLGSALLLLPLLRLALRIWGFQAVRAALVKTAPLPLDARAVFPAASPDSPERQEIARLVRMVNLAAVSGPVKTNCLPRSLAIWWLLRRKGLRGELKLGVKPAEAGIQAHAWVEFDGRVLGDEEGITCHFAAFEGLSADHEKQQA